MTLTWRGELVNLQKLRREPKIHDWLLHSKLNDSMPSKAMRGRIVHTQWTIKQGGKTVSLGQGGWQGESYDWPLRKNDSY